MKKSYTKTYQPEKIMYNRHLVYARAYFPVSKKEQLTAVIMVAFSLYIS